MLIIRNGFIQTKYELNWIICMNMKYKDYKPEIIATKLKEVKEFEAKWGESTRTKAIRKWCESIEYRKRDWEFRQATVNLLNFNNRYKIYK